jgi:hypothetical protein
MGELDDAKNSAEWWEKVAAQPIKPEHDPSPTTWSNAPIDQAKIPEIKTKPRKSFCGEAT